MRHTYRSQNGTRVVRLHRTRTRRKRASLLRALPGARGRAHTTWARRVLDTGWGERLGTRLLKERREAEPQIPLPVGLG